MDDLKIIKKRYGEKMMRLCRDMFPIILEQPSVLSNILLNYFEPQRFLYQDIIEFLIENEFKNYIYKIFYRGHEEEKVKTDKTCQELMSEAGYNLYECKTEEEIQYFKRYYASGEELCTFRGNRLNRCFVFFAVKKDVDDIKREDFKNPERQDNYGTSVISIQFTKDESHTLSIKNRYNHRVDNPDTTFSNNLDRIIPGLTKAFEQQYGLIQRNKNDDFEIPGYVKANDGKYYKYNIEINNIYYCFNNIIIDNFEVKRFPKEKYIVLDYFILNLKTGIIQLYDRIGVEDCFPETIRNVKNDDIKKVEVKKENEFKFIIFTFIAGENVIIKLDKLNNIVGLKNPNIDKINQPFLQYNKGLESLDMQKLESVKDDFLSRNIKLEEISLPHLKKIGNDFFAINWNIKNIKLPELEAVGNNFVKQAIIFELNLPKLLCVGNNFLGNNRCLLELYMPHLKKIGDRFLYGNIRLQKLRLPELEEIGNSFMCNNTILKQLDVLNLRIVGDCFLDRNISLTTLNMPKLLRVGKCFLNRNHNLEKIYMPLLEELGEYFLGIISDECEIVTPKYKTYVSK